MTIRQYKRKYFICKDDNGKMIYAGDTVEVQFPWETKTSHTSVVHWNRIDGAYVDSHPFHVRMNDGRMTHRSLRDYLGKQPQLLNYHDDTSETKYTKCVKIKSFYTAD